MLTAAVFSVLVSENARVLKGLDEIEFGANEDRQRVFGCAPLVCAMQSESARDWACMAVWDGARVRAATGWWREIINEKKEQLIQPGDCNIPLY